MDSLMAIHSAASPAAAGSVSGPSLLHRFWRKLCRRWQWRSSRSRHARFTLVSQFFPPDFAATGQLLDDLTQRFAALGLQVQVLTGMPAYAYNRSDAKRFEFHANRCIRRTNASRLWPNRDSRPCDQWSSLLLTHHPASDALFPPWRSYPVHH